MKNIEKIFLFVLGVHISSRIHAKSIDLKNDASKYLLPGNVIPLYYKLDLHTKIENFDENDEDSFVYEGQQTITILPVEDNVTSIVLHSYPTITVSSTTLLDQNGVNIDLSPASYDEDSDKLSYAVGNPLLKNQPLTLVILFTGKHRDTGRGFYRTYYEVNTEKRWLLTTQFEPVSGRTAFPSFDEPKYKALWKISVSLASSLKDQGYDVLSNSEKEFFDEINGRYTVHFKETPLPVSSYLIAIIVSDYKSTPTAIFNSSYPDPSVGEIKEFKSWGRPQYIDAGWGQTAQKVGPALLEIYTRNYNIGYGYRKLDQACVTNYGGGMENWGLVIYSESTLNDDPDRQQSITTLIAHELGHQWFGDLVTFHWWSDIWLNEGFATYTQYHGADQLQLDGLNVSNWKLISLFVTGVLQGAAFQSDVDEFTHPMTNEVYAPDEIGLYFDNIAYSKAGSVIRMWMHILGLETFNKGLQNYFQATRENVSTPEILLGSFDSVQNESASDLQGQTPSQIFKAWHTQSGYPVVTVTKSQDDPSVYVLSQERFSMKKMPKKAEEAWTIPISYSTSSEDNFNDTQATSWLKAEDATAQLILPAPVDWIVVNNQETGYYRVNYDRENWDKLFEILNNPDTVNLIHEINRQQILDDASNLARSTAKEYLSYDRAMNILSYLRHETAYYPWKSAFNNFHFLNNMLAKNRTVYPLFKTFTLSLMKDQYNRLSYLTKPTDTYEDKRLRDDILIWMCRMNHPDCFDKFLIKRDINLGVKRAVYCAAVRYGRKLKNEIDSKETKSLFGLGCTENKSLLKMYLHKVIYGNDMDIDIGKEEKVLSIVNENPGNVDVVFKFLRKNSDEIARTSGHDPLGKLLVQIAQTMGTDKDVLQVEKMILFIENSKDREVRVARRSALKALEIVKRNNEWLEMRTDSVYQWLVQHADSVALINK